MHSISRLHSPNCDFLTKLVAAEITEYVSEIFIRNLVFQKKVAHTQCVAEQKAGEI